MLDYEVSTAQRTILQGISGYGAHNSGLPKLSDAEVAQLKLDLATYMSTTSREEAVALNNKAVALIRADINYLLSPAYLTSMRTVAEKMARVGGPPARVMVRAAKATVRPRSGLVLPALWAEAYDIMVRSGVDCVLSGVVQNAILANEPAGETALWRNR